MYSRHTSCVAFFLILRTGMGALDFCFAKLLRDRPFCWLHSTPDVSGSWDLARFDSTRLWLSVSALPLIDLNQPMNFVGKNCESKSRKKDRWVSPFIWNGIPCQTSRGLCVSSIQRHRRPFDRRDRLTKTGNWLLSVDVWLPRTNLCRR